MNELPLLTLKRLPQYLELLYKYQREGLLAVSATRLADETGVHMTQVRKDLSFTGVVGVPKIGHQIAKLISAIETCLNWHDSSSCMLIGVGRLGSALLGYQELVRKGLSIVAAFDRDPSLAGTVVHETPIYPLSKFADLAQRLHIHIGIITVPAEAAQETADLMVSSGIIAIWNFTSVKLRVPAEIIVENVDMSASLAVLSRRLAEKLYVDENPPSQDTGANL